ncbi:ribonuclease III [Sediminibacterium sp.]|uniref:ribonuclease III n=1 Tax=Sediminibacterium sp. TaxID=1917865 RepID=UPI002724CE5B|nr:ribonuclease III [Sediminibacterium sp.]MDO9000422.1 ribonuclease III [Bacteroidota bacterium]MDP3147010.1 ribonuclease III [Bacteroidota bacterium]MDP3567453.1 ribonuclease III [Sediminibacterium sp.]
MTIKKLLSQIKFVKTKSDKNFKTWIKTTIGFTPKNLTLYQQAFLHSSAAAKRDNQPISNERLEFLGDAVLGAIIAEHLFKIYPYKDEGFLTQLRSKIVNGQILKELSLKFGFNLQLKANLTKDEKLKSSAYGDAFEAFIGAVYLDLGYEKTKKFITSKIIKFHIDISELVNTDNDFKSQLQIYCQKNKLVLEYKLLSEEKLGANKLYVIQVLINEKAYIKFENFSKRVAEQKAAQLTLEELQKEIG